MLVAFVPVLHQGYLEFFKRYGGELGILGPDVISEITPLTRDLRTLDSDLMRRAIESLGVVSSVRVLSKADLTTLGDVTMPDDDVMRDLAEAYNLRATFVPYFLRWDKMPATAFKAPTPESKVSVDELDRSLMRQAQHEATHSADWWRQIGALLVKDGSAIATAHNHHLPTDFHLMQNGDPRSNFNAGERTDIYTSIHAEASLIAQAARDGVSLRGASLYATTFPCPNCARLIAKSGISRVYFATGYSLLDAEEILQSHDVDLVFVDLANATD